MAHSNDIDSKAAELLLVDLLYGELEGDEEAAARKRVESDAELAADAAAFEGVRAMMRELPEEDPPPAISAQLLHAAAAQAPSPRGVAGAAVGGGFLAWIKRFFSPVMLHPAAAAVTTFVVIAGVAGTLYLTGKVDVADPKKSSSATPPAGVRHREADRKLDRSVEMGPTAPAAQDPTGGDFEAEILSESVTGEVTRGARAGKAGKKAGPRKEAEKPGGRWGGNTKNGDLASGESFEYGNVAKKPSPRPPADKAPLDDEDTTSNDYRDDVILAEPVTTPKLKDLDKQESERAQRTAKARTLHAKAVQAARDGECQAVIDIGQRIRKLDSRFYDTVYLADKRLYDCRLPKKKKGK